MYDEHTRQDIKEAINKTEQRLIEAFRNQSADVWMIHLCFDELRDTIKEI